MKLKNFLGVSVKRWKKWERKSFGRNVQWWIFLRTCSDYIYRNPFPILPTKPLQLQILLLPNWSNIRHTQGSCINLVWNLGAVDPGKEIDFQGKFPKKSIFFWQYHKQISIFRGKISEWPFFSHSLWNFLTKLAIYSYPLPNYSISLQKSPLLNILPVHNKI